MKQGEIWIWVSSFLLFVLLREYLNAVFTFPTRGLLQTVTLISHSSSNLFPFFFFFCVFPIRRWQKTACPEYLVNVRHCLVIIRITLASALWANRGGTVIVDRLCVSFFLNTGVWKGGQQQLAGKLLWSVRAVELWSSRANQRKTKAHNSRGLHSCWSAFNANRAYFHTPLIAWIDCLLNS